jgi:hypothetical protein
LALNSSVKFFRLVSLITCSSISAGYHLNLLSENQGPLYVSPHWLRYGSPNGEQAIAAVRQTKTQTNTALTEVEVGLISQYRQLSDHQKSLIADLVEQLAAEWRS